MFFQWWVVTQSGTPHKVWTSGLYDYFVVTQAAYGIYIRAVYGRKYATKSVQGMSVSPNTPLWAGSAVHVNIKQEAPAHGPLTPVTSATVLDCEAGLRLGKMNDKVMCVLQECIRKCTFELIMIIGEPNPYEYPRLHVDDGVFNCPHTFRFFILTCADRHIEQLGVCRCFI